LAIKSKSAIAVAQDPNCWPTESYIFANFDSGFYRFKCGCGRRYEGEWVDGVTSLISRRTSKQPHL
jgi:hypothetical protein